MQQLRQAWLYLFRNMQATTLFILLAFTLSSLPCRAWGKPLQSPLELETEAQQLLKAGKPDAAKATLDKALEAYQAATQAAKWIEAHKNFAKVYRDILGAPSAAEQQLQQALAYGRYFSKAQMDLAAWESLAWTHVNLAYLYAYYLSEPNLALAQYLEAAQVFQAQLHKEDLEVAAYVYREMGNLYAQAGDYKAAQVILSKAEKIALDYGDNDLAAQILCELGTVAFWLEQPVPANKYYETGLALQGISESSRALLLANQAKVLNKLGQHQRAFLSAQKAKGIFELVVSNPGMQYLSSNVPASMELMAESLLLEGNYPQSEKLLIEAARYYLSLEGQAATRKLAKCYYALGSLYLAWQRFEDGLNYHQKALQVLLPDAKLKGWQQNPEPEMLYSENTIMDALAGKATILYQWYQQDRDPAKLQTALACHELIFEVEQLLRRTYYYESSKLFNVEEARARSAHGIAIALELWRATRETQYQERALAFAERSKSTLLLEAFYKSRAEVGANIPQEVLAVEKGLQEEISGLEEKLFAARSAGSPKAELQALEKELLGLRQAYAVWVKGIEQNYPGYYRLKYDMRTLSSAQIRQQLLGKGQAFVEYFVAEQQIYVFVISRDKFEVLSLEKDFPLEEWVVQFRQSIEQFQHSSSNREALCATYNQLGWALYQRLIAPLEKLGLPDRLLIVPSGVLGFLPFDALLTAQPPASCQFAAYPYLLHRYTISQTYSATLQAGLLERPTANRRFAGFAPSFQKNGPFAELRYNKALLEAICRLNGGQPYLDDDATTAQLKAVAGQFGLLHFATHAEANTEEGDFSFILLADGRGGYDSLFVKDVYLLQLQAEMAVLSACETSVGTLYQGEGIISLARAFFYAGANSVITTLWSINEDANRELMEAFYGFLKKGHDKSAALRLAQLQQIEQSGKLGAHPAYWAAFTSIGNMRPVYANFRPYWAAALGMGLLLLGLGAYRWRRKR